MCNGVRSLEVMEAVQMTLLAPLAYTPPRYKTLRTRLFDEVNYVEHHSKRRYHSRMVPPFVQMVGHIFKITATTISLVCL